MSENQRPVLKKFRIENFTSIEKAEVNLSPLTVFIGPNNSGKTNFFRALAWFSQQVSGNQVSPFFEKTQHEGYGRYFYKFDTDKSISLGCCYKQGGSHVDYELEINTAGLAREKIEGEGITKKEERHQPPKPQLESADITNPASPIREREFRAYFQGLRYFSLRPQTISYPNNVFVTPQITFSGENVTATLDSLKGENPDTFDKIEKELRNCVPEVERIILKTVSNSVKQLEIKEKTCDKPFVGSEVSEGILLFITLLTIIHQPN